MSFSIWTRCAGDSELRTLRLSPWRVVEAQHQVSTRKLVDSTEEQILLEESVTATVALLGARNTLFWTIFYLRDEPISGSGTPLPPIFSNFRNDTTQQGTSLVWTHNVTPSATLNLSLTASQSKANTPPTGTTN